MFGAVVDQHDDRIVGHSDREHLPLVVAFLDDEVIGPDVDGRPTVAVDGGREHHTASDVLRR